MKSLGMVVTYEHSWTSWVHGAYNHEQERPQIRAALDKTVSDFFVILGSRPDNLDTMTTLIITLLITP